MKDKRDEERAGPLPIKSLQGEVVYEKPSKRTVHPKASLVSNSSVQSRDDLICVLMPIVRDWPLLPQSTPAGAIIGAGWQDLATYQWQLRLLAVGEG